MRNRTALDARRAFLARNHAAGELHKPIDVTANIYVHRDFVTGFLDFWTATPMPQSIADDVNTAGAATRHARPDLTHHVPALGK
jgi:hypothetical protein